MLGSGDIPFRNIDWKHLENDGILLKDLIKKCLVMNPQDRITAKEAIAHDWLEGVPTRVALAGVTRELASIGIVERREGSERSESSGN